MVTEPEHPYMAAWWPTGHTIGYEHLFSHQVRDLVVDVAQGRQPTQSFADGLQVQRVLDAVERSAAGGSGRARVCAAWQALRPQPAAGRAPGLAATAEGAPARAALGVSRAAASGRPPRG